MPFRRHISFIFMAALLMGGFAVDSYAQTEDTSEPFASEQIESFVANYEINTDNSLLVTETIVYNSGGFERHGIFRDIRTESAQGKEMEIEDVVVTDETGLSHEFQISNANTGVRIKIGDPDVTFSGEKTYVIKYRATNALSQLEQLDELYWNVTGDQWPFPIQSVKATVTPPPEYDFVQEACYAGSYGASTPCSNFEGTSSGVFESAAIHPYEGMTVAVGFNKGFLAAYPPPSLGERLWDFIVKWFYIFQYFIAAAIVVGTGMWCFKQWYRYGRDPKGTGMVISQYTVPDDLTPVEVALIYYGRLPNNAISAQILYLAKQGDLAIEQTNEKVLGVFDDKEFYLRQLKKGFKKANSFDSSLMQGLFASGGYVRVSSLKYKFFTYVKIISDLTKTAVKDKGYYTHFGPTNDLSALSSTRFVGIGIQFLFFAVFFGFIFSAIPILIALFFSFVFISVYVVTSAQRTEKGVATKEWLSGLKQYIEVAEKDRIEFHNAPSKTLEHFEQLLPYALVLGVSDIWIKQFAGIYEQSRLALGSNGDMSGFVSSFSHSMAASSTPKPSSSSGGSGGGGFSGGGGGGGGGGSW